MVEIGAGANGRTGKEWKKLLPYLRSRLDSDCNVSRRFCSNINVILLLVSLICRFSLVSAAITVSYFWPQLKNSRLNLLSHVKYGLDLLLLIEI